MSNPKIYKARCLALRRCSSPAQTATSIYNQGRNIDQCVAENELTIVRTIELEGVSGSVPGNRNDINDIIELKERYNDFTLVIVQDITRFSRAGVGHGLKLLCELRGAGLIVYFVAEDLLVIDQMTEMFAGFFFSAAHQTAKSIAYGAVNGTTNSFLLKRSPHCRIPPLGFDRMYSLDGKDLYIIRNLPDGTQVMLDAITREITRTFQRNEKKGIPNHYIKQKNEQVRLVPGDPKAVALVHMIFHRHFAEGKTCGMIARELNDLGIPSAQDREWHTVAVRQILLNPIYIGLAIRGRKEKAIYYVGSKEGAKPSSATFEELQNNPAPKLKKRKRDQWLEQEQPHLAEFLPENVRELARAKIEAYLDKIADAKEKKPGGDRHAHSPFLLKGILRSKQGNYPMTGRTTGKANCRHRSYGVARGISVPKSNNVLRHLAPAEPIERAVIDALKSVLLQRPELQLCLEELITKARKAKSEVVDEAALRNELKRKQKQWDRLNDFISGDDQEDDDLVKKSERIEREIQQIKAKLKAIQIPAAVAANPKLTAQDLAKKLEHMGQNLEKADVPAIRRLLETFISKLEYDLVTRTVDMEIALPSWIGEMAINTAPMCLDALLACKTVFQAHPENKVILGIFHCDQHGRPACVTCRRQAA